MRESYVVRNWEIYGVFYGMEFMVDGIEKEMRWKLRKARFH